MLTLKQERQIIKYLRANYNVTNIRFRGDGAVTANRTDNLERVFMGWNTDLLKESAEKKGDVLK